MKKIVTFLLAALLALTSFSLVGCGNNNIKIGVPNDTTNEARALLLLEANGIIKLREGAGITATKLDIVENPYNVEIEEIEAAAIPSHLASLDYAVINSNYALGANLNPKQDALLIESETSEAASAYANIIAVKSGNENTPKIKALVAALKSQVVKDFIAETYSDAVVSVVDEPTDGYDPTVDYAALSGQTIKVAASPTPHAEILNKAKEILAAKNITLTVQEFTDYVQPNNVVNDGGCDANYFQHLPYLTDFNSEKNMNLVSVGAIHFEPLGLYGGKQKTLDALKK